MAGFMPAIHVLLSRCALQNRDRYGAEIQGAT
jgi:hypothetical protein